MTDTNHLCELWEDTIAKSFKQDSKSKLGLMLKQWIEFNKLENFISILNYTIDAFYTIWKFELHESIWGYTSSYTIERSFPPKMLLITSYGSK